VKVRKETREKVEKAITRLTYRPNSLARSLTSLVHDQQTEVRLSLPRLITVGYISVDYIARVDVLPHRDDRITAHRIEKALGGPAANVAVAAAALGGDHSLDVELATAIGGDPDSDWALTELARKNVHALPIRAPYNNRLSRCLVIVEANGSRTIINEPFELTETDLTTHLAIEKEDRPRCLHVEGYHIGRMLSSIRRFQNAGWKVSLHTTGLPKEFRDRRSFANLVRSLDIVFLNAETARDVLGFRVETEALVEMFRSFLASLVKHCDVVLTLGGGGAVVFQADRHAAPDRIAAPVVDIVDTTGAGDAFAGAFLGFWLHGKTVTEAARFAAVAASLAVTAEGAQGRPVTAAEIASFQGAVAALVAS
jgi:sugar/nucleoside kinase (ribokinase family)